MNYKNILTLALFSSIFFSPHTFASAYSDEDATSYTNSGTGSSSWPSSDVLTSSSSSSEVLSADEGASDLPFMPHYNFKPVVGREDQNGQPLFFYRDPTFIMNHQAEDSLTVIIKTTRVFEAQENELHQLLIIPEFDIEVPVEYQNDIMGFLSWELNHRINHAIDDLLNPGQSPVGDAG